MFSAPLRAQTNKAALSGQTEEALRFLKGYIQINTSNPPGNEEATALYLKSVLDAEGIPCEIFVSTPGRANLLARLKAEGHPTEPPLLLMHHMDVVPADPSEWREPPFAAVE